MYYFLYVMLLLIIFNVLLCFLCTLLKAAEVGAPLSLFLEVLPLQATTVSCFITTTEGKERYLYDISSCINNNCLLNVDQVFPLSLVKRFRTRNF